MGSIISAHPPCSAGNATALIFVACCAMIFDRHQGSLSTHAQKIYDLRHNPRETIFQAEPLLAQWSIFKDRRPNLSRKKSRCLFRTAHYSLLLFRSASFQAPLRREV